MEYKIIYDLNPKEDDTKILWEGISEHARLMRGHRPGKAFAFFIKDELMQIKGGCSGYIFYGCLSIDLLWIESDLRGQGYGLELMKSAEELSKKNNCHFITVNTMDWEALDFYKKLGYSVEFKRQGFDKEGIFYFLRKELD